MTTIKLAPQPTRLTTPLYPHQKANIYLMEQLEKNKSLTLPSGDILQGNVGILGDPPGTGKTKTIIGLVCRDKMDWSEPLLSVDQQVCSNLDGSIRIIRKNLFSKIKTTLIVTPLSIFHQWEQEIKESDLTFKMVERKTDARNLEDYDIVVCTINMYNHVASLYREFAFKRFVYDEMDSAYITNMESIQAGFLWFVSATFTTVLSEINRSRKIHYMKRLFMNIISNDYDATTLLNSITVKSTPKLWALKPIPFEYQTIHYDIKESAVIRGLREFMDTDLIEMIESGNIKDAIRHLGGSEDNSSIAELIRSRAKAKVQEAEEKVARYTGRQKDEWEEKLGDFKRILQTIDERINNISTDNCDLCGQPMNGTVLFNCCQNLVCAKCSVRWLMENDSCPYCRKIKPDITHMSKYDSPEEKKEEQELKAPPMSKLDTLKRIVQKGKKVLIYASYDNIFGQICSSLDEIDASYSLLQGAVSRRQTVLDGFTKGSTQVLILNSRLNGAGLNLQITTDIVIWHPMSPDLLKQMIGRALRYGLSHPLIVHKLFKESDEATE